MRRATKKIIPKKGMPLLARTLEKFRLEVTALLVVGHGWTPKAATKAVKRWDRYVRRRWKEGKPPCAVADHLSKWKKEGSVCPCKGPDRRGSGKARDCARCDARRARGKGDGGRSSGRSSSSPFFHRDARDPSRDADNPKEGELFESKRGNRWRIVSIDGDRYFVESEGRKTPGRLAWSRSNIRGMKTVESKGASSPGQLSLFGNDPGRRFGGRRKSIIQTVLFHRKRFSVLKAKTWARRHGFRFGKVDTTKNYYRLRQIDPKKVKVRATITLAPGILAIVGNKRG